MIRTVPLLLGAAFMAAPVLAAEGGNAGMPQLDPSGYAPQLVWLTITFVVLYLVLSRVALPRIAGVLEERHGKLADDLDEAERLKRETEKAIAEYEAALAQARTEAQAIAAETRQQANLDAAAARSQIDAALSEQGRAAEARIQAARAQALAGVNQAAADVAREVVERLLGTAPADGPVNEAVRAARSGGR